MRCILLGRLPAPALIVVAFGDASELPSTVAFAVALAATPTLARDDQVAVHGACALRF